MEQKPPGKKEYKKEIRKKNIQLRNNFVHK